MNDQENQEPGILQHDAEHTRPHKKVSVMGYLAILFAAAFLLLLLSYLMQQRNSEAVISGLKDTSVSAVQTLENIMVEKDRLSELVEELEGQIKDQNATLVRAQAENRELVLQADALQKQVEALDYLRRIQAFYEIQYYRHAREAIAAFEAAGLDRHLPTVSYVPEQPSPSETYRTIYQALFPTE